MATWFILSGHIYSALHQTYLARHIFQFHCLQIQRKITWFWQQYIQILYSVFHVLSRYTSIHIYVEYYLHDNNGSKHKITKGIHTNTHIYAIYHIVRCESGEHVYNLNVSQPIHPCHTYNFAYIIMMIWWNQRRRGRRHKHNNMFVEALYNFVWLNVWIFLTYMYRYTG